MEPALPRLPAAGGPLHGERSAAVGLGAGRVQGRFGPALAEPLWASWAPSWCETTTRPDSWPGGDCGHGGGGRPGPLPGCAAAVGARRHHGRDPAPAQPPGRPERPGPRPGAGPDPAPTGIAGSTKSPDHSTPPRGTLQPLQHTLPGSTKSPGRSTRPPPPLGWPCGWSPSQPSRDGPLHRRWPTGSRPQRSWWPPRWTRCWRKWPAAGWWSPCATTAPSPPSSATGPR